METLDLTSKDFKMPGYTGYMPGTQETFARTPVMSQVEAKAPSPDSFLFTRTHAPPANYPPARDPTVKHPEADVLWPGLLESAVQGSLKPPPNYMALGDHRIDVFRTSYKGDFKAPFKAHELLRSPNRNEDLAKTTTSLTGHYLSAYNRVSEKRLQKIISTMRERLEAKMGNQNNNAFKFRKLFQSYDTEKTGMVQIEVCRNVLETFGCQLDDDSLLALFYVYDPEGTGYLNYLDLVKHLMERECYSLYTNDLDVSEARAAEDVVLAQLGGMQKKFAPRSADLLDVLQALDPERTGVLSVSDLMAGCASLGLVLGDRDMNSIASYAVVGGEGDGTVFDDTGNICYANFIAMLNAGRTGLTKRARNVGATTKRA